MLGPLGTVTYPAVYRYWGDVQAEGFLHVKDAEITQPIVIDADIGQPLHVDAEFTDGVDESDKLLKR